MAIISTVKNKLAKILLDKNSLFFIVKPRNIEKEDPMRKFVAVLIFLTLMIVRANAGNLTIRAFDVNASPFPGPDINADILWNSLRP